jgi:hypothetical protein
MQRMIEPPYSPGGSPFQWWHVSLHDPTDVDLAAVDHALSQPGFASLSMDLAGGLGNHPPVDENGYLSELPDTEIFYNKGEYAILEHGSGRKDQHSFLPWSSPLLEWPGGPPYITSPFERVEFANCSSPTYENDSEICAAAGGTIRVDHGSVLQQVRTRGNGSGGQAPSKAPSKIFPAESEADKTWGKKRRKFNNGRQDDQDEGGDQNEDEIRGGREEGGGGEGAVGREDKRLLSCIFYLQDGAFYNLLEWNNCGIRHVQISH